MRVLNPENRLVVSLLPRPPALVWFTKNGPLPTNGYTDKSVLVNSINQVIQKFNSSNGFNKLPTFHLMGIRGGNSTRNSENVITKNMSQHVWSYWREYDLRNKDSSRPKCLHLTDPHRCVIYNRFVKFAKISLMENQTPNSQPSDNLPPLPQHQ